MSVQHLDNLQRTYARVLRKMEVNCMLYFVVNWTFHPFHCVTYLSCDFHSNSKSFGRMDPRTQF